MAYEVVDPFGKTLNTHANYSPAETEAKELPNMRVIYYGIRGMCVQVWPLVTS